MSHIHFQYAVEIRRVLKQAGDGVTRKQLFNAVDVNGKTELRFGETLAELCQGRDPDVVMVKAPGTFTKYYLSANAVHLLRTQPRSRATVLGRAQDRKPTPAPAPPPPPPPPAPVLSPPVIGGSRWRHIPKTEPVPAVTHRCGCGAEIVHRGRGPKPRQCRDCRAKGKSKNPLAFGHCPTCGHKLRKPFPQETKT